MVPSDFEDKPALGYSILGLSIEEFLPARKVLFYNKKIMIRRHLAVLWIRINWI
jgi:hypothetical protein